MSNAPEQLPGETNKKTPLLLYILLGVCGLAALLLAGVLGARLVWDIWGSPPGKHQPMIPGASCNNPA